MGEFYKNSEILNPLFQSTEYQPAIFGIENVIWINFIKIDDDHQGRVLLYQPAGLVQCNLFNQVLQSGLARPVQQYKLQ